MLYSCQTDKGADHLIAHFADVREEDVWAFAQKIRKNKDKVALFIEML